MKKMISLSFTILLSQWAQAGDLVLPGAKWVAGFNKYVCAAYGESTTRPQALEQINVQFEQVVSDSTLDHALLTATFEEKGVSCRYNAIIQADNEAQTSQFIQSIAYNPAAKDGSAYIACSAGKNILDKAFAANKYLYYGHPHNLAFMAPGLGAESVCGSDMIGVNFIVKGRLPTPNP